MKVRQRLVDFMQLISAMLIAGSLLCPNSHASQTDASHGAGQMRPVISGKLLEKPFTRAKTSISRKDAALEAADA